MLEALFMSAALGLGQVPVADAPRSAATLLPPVEHVDLGHRQAIPTASVQDATLPKVPALTPAAPWYSNSSIIYVQEPMKIDGKNGDEPNGNGDEEEPGPWRAIQNPILGYKVTGFLYGTGNLNALDTGNRYNGPLTMSDQQGVYLNQLYLDFNRAMEDTFTIGGGLSMLYGNDYNASQSFGFELNNGRGLGPAGRFFGPLTQKWNNGQDYGIILPQLYSEFGTKKASLMVGHFWTPIGHCVVPAIGNFFNTQPYQYMHGQPFEHWGAMAKVNPNDNLSGYFGVVNGINALDRQVNSPSFIFGGKIAGNENKWYINNGMYIGQEPENIGPGYANRVIANNVLYYDLTERITLTHELTVGVQNNRGLPTSTYYGFGPYIFYKICDNLKFGIRGDFFHDPGGIVAGIRSGNQNLGPYSGNFWVIDAGLNWAPGGSKNLMIRPEIRYDWFGGNGSPYSFGTRKDMLLLMLGSYFLF